MIFKAHFCFFAAGQPHVLASQQSSIKHSTFLILLCLFIEPQLAKTPYYPFPTLRHFSPVHPSLYVYRLVVTTKLANGLPLLHTLTPQTQSASNFVVLLNKTELNEVSLTDKEPNTPSIKSSPTQLNI